MNILRAMSDPAVMGQHFTGPSWQPWRAVLAAAFALPMTDEQHEVFAKLSGGREAPRERTREAFIIAGRRSAKSHIAAATAVYT
ncbi:MAG: hypothetical protein JJT85_11080, partial [Chromatiales bacterium]|nr:hypothetical protein [Chromatiales bacterium]